VTEMTGISAPPSTGAPRRPHRSSRRGPRLTRRHCAQGVAESLQWAATCARVGRSWTKPLERDSAMRCVYCSAGRLRATRLTHTFT
jgi:hypothetical protein